MPPPGGPAPILHDLARRQQDSAGLLVDLLRVGADPRQVDARDGQTALHVAAAAGHVQLVAALLDAGAEPNASSRDGKTALHLAASRSEAVSRCLLDRGGLPEAKDESGITPLMSALAARADTVAALLLDRGADASAMAYVSSCECPAILVCLGYFDGLLYERVAAPPVSLALLQRLLRQGADPNAEGAAGLTAFQLALVAKPRPDLALALVHDARFDVNRVDSHGDTPLLLALRQRCSAAVSALVRRGARRDVRDRHGRAASELAESPELRAALTAGRPRRAPR